MWFSQTKFASFQRQLNLYGFRRLTSGPDKGAYYHEHFLRGQRARVQQLNRHKIKGVSARRPVVQDTEHNILKMPHMLHSKTSSIRTNIRINAPDTKNAESSSGPPTPTLSEEEESSEEAEKDVLFFEGKPFHYLDRLLVVANYVPVDETRGVSAASLYGGE